MFFPSYFSLFLHSLLGFPFQERTTEDSNESESFKELLTARTHEFIEEVLTPHFGNMIMFVKDCEAAIERGNMDLLKREEGMLKENIEHSDCS